MKFKNVQQAIAHYLAKTPWLEGSLGRHSEYSKEVAGLPAEYDSTPYSTIVDGKLVSTVGEYKAAWVEWHKTHDNASGY